MEMLKTYYILYKDKKMKYKYITDLKKADDIRELYQKSFPECEQIDFYNFFSGEFENFLLVGQYDNNKIVGMMHFIQTPNFVHLNYLAVEPNMRKKGYGSKCLNWLKRKYPNSPIVVDVEEIEENCDNNLAREQRQKFYMKNKFKKGYCIFHWQSIFMTYMSNKPLDEGKFLKHITRLFPTITNIQKIN